MKKLGLIVVALALTLAGCNSDEKKASELFQRAEVSFAAEDYSLAKLQIDSIRTLYPKAFEVRKAAIGLMQQVDLKEQQQTLAYLDELSNVFRYILQSNKKELVTLAEELQFVKAYTYLLSVRYEGKLFFSIQADTPYLLWYLPILSVLPLIENAVKHNVISKQYPLQIDIYTTHEDKLIISNKIHPKSEDSKGSGIGLKNLWGRYRMLTGKDIQISNRKEYFKVTLPLLNKPIHS